MICRKNVTSYCYFQKAGYTVFAKKTCSWSAKKTWSIKHYRILGKMQYCLCIMPFLEVTILFNQHFTIVGNTVGKSPTGILSLFISSWNPLKNPGRHSNSIYLVLNPLKLKKSWRIFDRPVSSMYCKYEEYECKLQKYLPMINKTWQNMQKTCNIVIRRSKNTSFTHI